MQIDVFYRGGQQFQAVRKPSPDAANARNLAILSEYTIEDSASHQGMCPSEWLLAALGSCAAEHAVQYLQCRGLDAIGLCVHVSARACPLPAPRFDEIVLHISLPAALEDPDYVGLQRAVEVCDVFNTLTYLPKIKTRITASSMLVG